MAALEEAVSALESSEYYPVVEVSVAVPDGGRTWVPAVVESWKKAAGSTDSVGVVSFVGFDEVGEYAASEMRPVCVPESVVGRPVKEAKEAKIGSRALAVYLEDRKWYEATIVDVHAKRGFATVLFTEYDETQATALCFVRLLEEEEEEEEDSASVDESVEAKSRLEYYVGLARSGVPLEVVEHAAMREDASLKVREAVEESRRRDPERATVRLATADRSAVVAELERSQCFEDAFLRRVFDFYDTREPRGQLCPMDFVDALKKTPSLAKSSLALFKDFDVDDDGGVDLDEFKRGVRELARDNSSNVQTLVWYWRELQEEWWSGTGKDTTVLAEDAASAPARRGVGRGAFSSRRKEAMRAVMQVGGGPRELALPCLVKLDRRVATIWTLASTKEAAWTSLEEDGLPEASATFAGLIRNVTVLSSRVQRALSRCDVVLKLARRSKKTDDVKLWLPRGSYVERARWVTELDRCAALARASVGGDDEFFDDAAADAAADNVLVAMRADDESMPANEVVVCVHKGRDLLAKDTGYFRSGKSDPYVRVFLEDKPGLWRATRVVQETLSPDFCDQVFSIPLGASNKPLVVVCADHDRPTRDDFMGSLRVPLDGRGLLVAKKWLDLRGDDIPRDALTAKLADADPEKAAKVTGQLQLSVAVRRSSDLVFDLDAYVCDHVLVLGVIRADLPLAKSTRVLARLLGLSSEIPDKATTVRPDASDPVWAETLAFDHFLPPEDNNLVLELVLEDAPYESAKTAIGVAHHRLDPAKGLKQRLALPLRAPDPPVGSTAPRSGGGGTLHLNLVWVPPASL